MGEVRGTTSPTIKVSIRCMIVGGMKTFEWGTHIADVSAVHHT